MIDTNYPIEALEVLLNKDCLSARYYPLVLHRDRILSRLLAMGCRTRLDAAALPDAAFEEIGLDAGMVRRFLAMYEPNPQKFREIPKLTSDPEEQAVFRELYCLPGVKFIRASLYYRAGYKSLSDFAETTPEEVLERTAYVIKRDGLSCIVPLPKEVRTHIAVAKAFCSKQEEKI